MRRREEDFDLAALTALVFTYRPAVGWVGGMGEAGGVAGSLLRFITSQCPPPRIIVSF